MKWVKISEVRANPNNPRIIRDEKFAKLKQSIIDFPEMLEKRPLVCYTEGKNYIVLGGNMRLKALSDIGAKEVPIILADEWTEEQRAQFLIKDNVGYGEWDWDDLANNWDAQELTEWGLDIPNFEVNNLEAEEDNFAVPEGGIETDIVLGDLFEIGEHRLLCGDSTDSDQVAKLMNGQKIDLVFTSPPYNSGLGKGSKTDRLNGHGFYENENTDKKTKEEYINFNKDIINTLYNFINEHTIICYNINYNKNSPSEYIDIVNEINKIISLKETIVWEKTMAISLVGNNLTRIYEFLFVFCNNNIKMNKSHNECIKNLWKINNVGANNDIHKACFPIEFASKGINIFSFTNNLIYEPFTGSGSTMVASHQLKRKCYGMELDPKYCQVIIDRMIKLDPTLEIKRNGQPYKTAK